MPIGVWQIEVAIEISIINKNVTALRRPIGLITAKLFEFYRNM